jgi:hypothetical protein
VEENASKLIVGENTGELAALADTLIPGDGEFPSASAVGAHGLLVERLRERLGPQAIDLLLRALRVASGGSLVDLAESVRVDAVRRLERDEPDLFAVVRTALYYSYYQSPLVIAVIRGLGFAYNDAPQPLGYALDPFDSTPGKDAPADPRGVYIPTHAIRRVEHLPAAARASDVRQ